MRLPSAIEPRLDTPAPYLLLPRFQVDTLSPGGETTLIALTWESPRMGEVWLQYFEPDGDLLGTDLPDVSSLSGLEVLTVNLRDRPEALTHPDPEGHVRGWARLMDPAVVEGLGGDFFQVDPEQDFASGSRMAIGGRDKCAHWEIRYLVGGPFSGGTMLVLWVDAPLGGERAVDPPTLALDVYGEDGVLRASIRLWTDDHALEVVASDILGLLPGAAPFGAFEVRFLGGAQGVVQAEYRAEGRYSVNHAATRVDDPCAFADPEKDGGVIAPD